MSNILKENIDFINLLAVTILLYNLHSLFADNNWELTLINSIYIFNFFAVLFFIISLRINIAQKLVKPLTFFILLTFVKMLATIVFFIYYKNDSFYDIKIVAYNFFPVYFLFLTFEIFSLKKTFNNI